MGMEPLLCGYLYDTCDFSSMFEWVQGRSAKPRCCHANHGATVFIRYGRLCYQRTITSDLADYFPSTTGSAMQSSTADEHWGPHDGAITVLYI